MPLLFLNLCEYERVNMVVYFKRSARTQILKYVGVKHKWMVQLYLSSTSFISLRNPY